MNKHTAWGHARFPGVQPQAKGQRANGQIKICVGSDKDGVAAAQFHRGGQQPRGKLRENCFTGGGGTGEENLVDVDGESGLRSFGGFRQERAQSGVESGGDEHLQQATHRSGAAGSRLHKHRITGGECLKDLNTGQQQRVVAGANDQDNAERFAANLRRHARKPERTRP